MPLDETAYWLGFSRVPGIARRRVEQLLNHFISLQEAWHAPDSALRHAGLGDFALQALAETRRKLDLQMALDKIHAVGAHLITLDSPDYPVNLKPVRSAPILLHVLGALTASDQRALAIIGTRKATPSGKDTARQFARDLAGQGVTIISGLALGIDASAHQGALDAGGRTIAVLGCGIDVVYPRQNKALAEAIASNGAVISEFPLGEPPVKQNFPRRNRILSGLALGVLVVEAPEASGTMHTVTAALDQGRDVFAIPHSIQNMQGRGGNRLIQDGAKLILEPQDILTELNLTAEMVAQRTQAQRITADSAVEAQVLEYLSDTPIHVDELARQTGLKIADLSATLTLLELKGLAQPVGIMQYCATYR